MRGDLPLVADNPGAASRRQNREPRCKHFYAWRVFRSGGLVPPVIRPGTMPERKGRTLYGQKILLLGEELYEKSPRFRQQLLALFRRQIHSHTRQHPRHTRKQ
jgi:hypothetical protein